MLQSYTNNIIVFSTLLIVGCSTANETKINSEANKYPRTNQTEQDNSLDLALDDLTNQIVTSLSEKQKSRIAVLEFLDLEGRKTNLGRFIAEELITRLFITQKFYVIERQLLNKILEEHKLTTTGLIDENSAKQLGKILGVDAIASGTVTDLTNSVKVNSRLFSTETGSIFSVASVEVPKTDDVKKLIGFLPTTEEKEDEISVTTKGNIFCKENFSNVKEGFLPANWIGGEKLMVKGGDRGNYVMDFEKHPDHKVTINNINFPQNFELKVTAQLGEQTRVTNKLAIYVNNINLAVNIDSGCRLNNTTNKVNDRGYGYYKNKVIQITLR